MVDPLTQETPDPNPVQRALDRVREDRRKYAFIGIAVLVVVLGGLVVANLPGDAAVTSYGPVWTRYNAVHEKLRRGLSAQEEIAALEAHLEKVRGEPAEGLALWLLALSHSGEAWLDEKTAFDERKPHLEKARGYLRELKADERFDRLPVTRQKWFTSGGKAPLDRLLEQVEKDLAWAAEHAYEEPATYPGTVVVLRTELGDIHLQFYADLASAHMKNFVTLVQTGAYNGTMFHFVRGGNQEPTGVMAGDPYTFFYNDPFQKKHILRWGSGGVGYGLPPEESRFRVDHRRGVVTSQRVRKADWDNGIQFQILVDRDRTLDREHTPFAKVVQGMDVVDQIAKRKTAADHPTYKDSADFASLHTRDLLVEPVVIHKAIAYEKGAALAHEFPLADGERTLEGLSDTPVEPLSEEELLGAQRRLLDPRAGDASPVRGLSVPYPADADLEKAKPKGDRKTPE